MSHVEFKKCPFHPYDLRGQGPYHSPMLVHGHSHTPRHFLCSAHAFQGRLYMYAVFFCRAWLVGQFFPSHRQMEPLFYTVFFLSNSTHHLVFILPKIANIIYSLTVSDCLIVKIYIHGNLGQGRLCWYIYIYIMLKQSVLPNTVNVDIFKCIHFHGFMIMSNFACIQIHVLSIIVSWGCYTSNFRGVHIFLDI